MPHNKPLVVVTRRLPDTIETRLRELFKANLFLLQLPPGPQSHLPPAVVQAEVQTKTAINRAQLQLHKALHPIFVKVQQDQFWLTDQIPMAVVAASVDLLRLFDTLATRTNRYLRSDLAIAAVLADATARSSRWNVLINSRELPADERSRVEAELGRMLDTSARLCVAVEGKCGE